MAAPPHLVSVDKYLVFHCDAQRAAVHDHNVKTVYDLFNAVWFDSDRLSRDPSRMYRYVLHGHFTCTATAADSSRCDMGEDDASTAVASPPVSCAIKA